MVEEAKEREVRMQNKVKTMEKQIQVLNERDQEVSYIPHSQGINMIRKELFSELIFFNGQFLFY